MPFAAYGVLRGTLTRWYRDDPDDFGRWRHVHLVVEAGTPFEVAIDVDSHQSSVGVQWKLLTLTAGDLGFPGLSGLPAPGFHQLATAPGTGALDYIRHPALRTMQVIRVARLVGGLLGALPLVQRWRLMPTLRLWRSGDWVAASVALESALRANAAVLVWGEPFPEGTPTQRPVQGVHNVHQNQGDPVGSQWWAENGVWQDGGVAVQQADGRWCVFVSRFSSQADQTDAAGHPV